MLLAKDAGKGEMWGERAREWERGALWEGGEGADIRSGGRVLRAMVRGACGAWKRGRGRHEMGRGGVVTPEKRTRGRRIDAGGAGGKGGPKNV